MHRFIIALLAMAPAAGEAQTAPTSESATYATSTEVQQLIARAAATIKPGEPVLVQPLLQFTPYNAILEFRQAATGAAVHKDEAEFFYVVQGSGTLVQGGTMIGSTSPDPHNLSGTGITGGACRHVAAGDVLVIPEGTPHWFNGVDGRLIMVSMKVPRAAAGRP